MAFFTDFDDAVSANLAANVNLSKGVLAINAAAAATVKTTNALTYMNGGLLLSKAALAAQSIAVTHDARGGTGGYVQPANTTVVYTLGLNAAGTVCVAQSDFAGRDLSQFSAGASLFGNGFVADVPAGYTAIGLVKVVTNGSTTFTAGTTALDAAGLTVTYADVGLLPRSF